MAKTVETFTTKAEDLGPSKFSDILKSQKKDKAKEKDAIANSAVQFLANKRIELGYTSDVLKDQQIGSTAQSVIRNFSDDLDSLRDVDNYTEFNDFVKDQVKIVKEFQKALKETKGEGGKVSRYGQLSGNELAYIVNHMQPVVEQLKNVTGITERVKFKVDEIKSAFKPAKIIDRLFGSDEGFIGKRIRAAIQRQQRAEEKVAQTQRGAVGEKFRAKLDKLEDKALGYDDDDFDDFGSFRGSKQKFPREELFDDDFSGMPSGRRKSQSVANERRSEAAELAENRYEESKNVFEAISDNTELTAQYLADLVDVEKKSLGMQSKQSGVGGFFSSMAGKGKNILGKTGGFLKNAGRVGLNVGRGLLTAVGGTTAATIGGAALAAGGIAYGVKKAGDRDMEQVKKGEIPYDKSIRYQSEMNPYGAEDVGLEKPKVEKPGTYTEYNKQYLDSIGEETIEPGAKFVTTPYTKFRPEKKDKSNAPLTEYAYKIAGEKVIPGKELSKNQVEVMKLGLGLGKQYPPEIMDQFNKQQSTSSKIMNEVNNRPDTEDTGKTIFNTPVINQNNSTNQSVQNNMDVSATNKDQTFRTSIASAEF